MVDEKNQVGEEQLSEEDLDRIMKDIVAEEAAAVAEAAPSATTSPSADPVPTEVPVAEVTKVEPARPEPVKAKNPSTAVPVSKSNVTPIKSGDATPNFESNSMRLDFTGNISLCFTVGGKTVELQCSESSLVCKLADGTEFKVPIGTNSTAVRKTG